MKARIFCRNGAWYCSAENGEMKADTFRKLYESARYWLFKIGETSTKQALLCDDGVFRSEIRPDGSKLDPHSYPKPQSVKVWMT